MFKTRIRQLVGRAGWEVHRSPFGYELTRRSQFADPVEATEADERILATVQPYTMTGRLRTFALMNSVRYVVENDIPGDFVECGVWRGGSAMAMALTLLDLGVRDRKIWLYDTYEGMTAPSDEDVDFTGRPAADDWRKYQAADGGTTWCLADLDDVRRNMESTKYPQENLRFIQGDVSLTLLEETPEVLAILRLDTDFYVSTRDELQVLYPRLSLGGVCVVDDYGHFDGARKAIDEYFVDHAPRPLINRIDYTGRVFVKTR